MNKIMTIHEVSKSVGNSVRFPSARRFVFGMANDVGEFVRQGDVYIEKINPIKNLNKVKKFNGQLAPGNTRGSRHCVDTKKVNVYISTETNVETGPILEVLEDVDVTHPDHGHIGLVPGWYAVTYQVNYANKQRTRVKD